MQGSEIPRAVAAARSIAASLGLPVDDAVVLHASNRLAVRLLPCAVLARVHLWRIRPARSNWRLLGGSPTGCPVAALAPRVAPRAYVRDGFVITLWTYYEPATS